MKKLGKSSSRQTSLQKKESFKELVDAEETSQSSSDSCISLHDSESGDEDLREVNDEPELEKYYAVAYSDKYHIGKLQKIENDQCQMTFLEEFLKIFKWPKVPDVDTVEKKYIIYGPIHFKNYPFRLSRFESQKINKIFKEIKT